MIAAILAATALDPTVADKSYPLISERWKFEDLLNMNPHLIDDARQFIVQPYLYAPLSHHENPVMPVEISESTDYRSYVEGMLYHGVGSDLIDDQSLTNEQARSLYAEGKTSSPAIESDLDRIHNSARFILESLSLRKVFADDDVNQTKQKLRSVLDSTILNGIAHIPKQLKVSISELFQDEVDLKNPLADFWSRCSTVDRILTYRLESTDTQACTVLNVLSAMDYATRSGYATKQAVGRYIGNRSPTSPLLQFADSYEFVRNDKAMVEGLASILGIDPLNFALSSQSTSLRVNALADITLRRIGGSLSLNRAQRDLDRFKSLSRDTIESNLDKASRTGLIPTTSEVDASSIVDRLSAERLKVSDALIDDVTRITNGLINLTKRDHSKLPSPKALATSFASASDFGDDSLRLLMPAIFLESRFKVTARRSNRLGLLQLGSNPSTGDFGGPYGASAVIYYAELLTKTGQKTRLLAWFRTHVLSVFVTVTAKLMNDSDVMTFIVDSSRTRTLIDPYSPDAFCYFNLVPGAYENGDFNYSNDAWARANPSYSIRVNGTRYLSILAILNTMLEEGLIKLKDKNGLTPFSLYALHQLNVSLNDVEFFDADGSVINGPAITKLR